MTEGPKRDPSEASAKSTNPILLVAVLAVSFGLSVALLFMETESRRVESRTKAMARQELAEFYTLSHRPEPYQQTLRKALQAHNRGKYADEQRYYRRVLNMLHQENLDPLKGLTGVKKGATPPNDQHLEALLARLLSDERS